MMLAFGKQMLVALVAMASPLIWARVSARRTAPRSNISPAGDRLKELPPVLLTTPSYLGTLAAVRCLGRNSIQVTTAGPKRYSVSNFSKYTTRNLICPPPFEVDEFLDWLEDFGRSNERHALLPTCDDTAWLYAQHRERLSRYFYVGPTSAAAVHNLLHKGLMAEHAAAAGLDVPRSWFPVSEHDLQRVAEEATFPVLIKATSQVLFESHSKGARVDRAEDLAPTFRSFSALRHAPALGRHDPSAVRPLIQEFFPEASDGIYNVSSYARGGRLCGSRAGRKVLQRPRRVGIGLCFEEAPLEPQLVQGLERLVERIGFTGVFEAEFIRTKTRDVLIDFNPRFYNQMNFDIARGLPLPIWCYYDAITTVRTPEQVEAGPAGQGLTGQIFAYGSAFKLMIVSQRLSGALSPEEADGWLRWYESHEGRRVDAVADADDVWPERFDMLEMLRHHVRHPGDFLRSVALNR